MTETGQFGTYDFETYDWTQPLCGDMYDGLTHTFTLDRESPTTVVRSMLLEMEGSEVKIWWAHNGGKFDALFIIDCVRQMPRWKCDGSVAAGRIINLRIMSPNNTWVLKDSFAVIQSSLDKALHSFGIPHKKVFTKDDYQKLETDPRAMCKHSDVKLREGCQADTKSLWHLVHKAESMFREWGGDLKATFSASALTVVKAKYGKPLASHEGNQWANDIARRTYSGGRVEVFKHMPKHTLREYDITSSYPWSMTQPLPWHLLGWGKPELYNENILSIVYAKVTVPPQYIPPLPYVPPAGGLFFPVGTWSGWFTSVELAYAIDYCGVTARFHDSVNYSVERPFEAFVKEVFKVKQESTGAMREFTKLILNGCYGKFGQKPENTKLQVFNDPEEAWEWARSHSRQQPKAINAENTAWETKSMFWPKHTHYALASFVTAYSRILLHKHLTAAADNGISRQLAYCDTDSVHCSPTAASEYFSGVLQSQGDGLGGLKLAKDDFRASYYAPKLYSLHPVKRQDADVYHSKGFPVSADAFNRVVRGERVGNPKGRMQLVKTQIRKGTPVIHLTEAETAKQWHGQSNKRFAIPGDPEGDTEPWDVRELHEGIHETQQSPLFRPKLK